MFLDSVYYAQLKSMVGSSSSSASDVLPSITDGDESKVLTVVDGEWNKAEIPAGLPEITAADEGSVLKVVDGVAQWVALG